MERLNCLVNQSPIINIRIILRYQQSNMFFGKILASGQTFKFNPADAEDSQGEVLSITNVVLAPTSKDSASLYIKKENQEFLIATLTKEKSQVVVNVFISLLDQVSLVVKGNGTLHVTGFYEPDQEGELPLEDLEDEDEDEEDEEEVIKPTPAVATKAASPVQKPQSPAQKPQPAAAAKPVQEKKPAPAQPAKAPVAAEEEEDDDEEDLDEDIEDDEDLDDDLEDEEEGDDDEDDEDDEDEEEEVAAAPVKQVKQDFKPQQGGKPQGNNQGGKPFGQNQGGKPFNNNKQGGNWNNKPQGGNGKPFNNNHQGGNKGGFNKGGNNGGFNKGGFKGGNGGNGFNKNHGGNKGGFNKFQKK